MRGLVWPSCMLIVWLHLVWALPADAQATQRLNTSVRAAGRGYIDSAVFWEPHSAAAENPALLGYARGFTCSWASADLEVNREVDEGHISLGRAGVGLALGGWPLESLGGTEFRMHDIMGYGPSGELLGEMTYRDEAHDLTLGVNVAEFAETIAPHLGWEAPGISRWIDLSLGFTRSLLRASIDGQSGGSAEAVSWDVGLLARLTPIDTERYGGLRLDGAYGQAWGNITEAEFRDETPSAAYEMDHRGGALRVQWGLAPALPEGLRSVGPPWLARICTPLLTAVGGRDQVTEHSGFCECDAREFACCSDTEEEQWGYEITILNIFTLRRGTIETDDGHRRDARGWGVGLSIGDFGGLRYDEATIPERESYLGDFEPHGFMVFCDPWKIWESWRGRPE